MVADETELSQSSKLGAGGVLPEVADTPGELWWRYEPPPVDGGAADRTKNGNSAVAGGTSEGGGLQSTDNGEEGCLSREGSGSKEEVTVRVNCAIRVLDPKDGVYECHPDGKEAQTVGAK